MRKITLSALMLDLKGSSGHSREWITK